MWRNEGGQREAAPPGFAVPGVRFRVGAALEGLRGDGLGRDLLRRAEVEALSRGCRNAWLDTYSLQARGFYEKLGYRVFGTLVDYPPGHHRFFLQKRLSKRSSSQASARSPR